MQGDDQLRQKAEHTKFLHTLDAARLEAIRMIDQEIILDALTPVILAEKDQCLHSHIPPSILRDKLNENIINVLLKLGDYGDERGSTKINFAFPPPIPLESKRIYLKNNTLFLDFPSQFIDKESLTNIERITIDTVMDICIQITMNECSGEAEDMHTIRLYSQLLSKNRSLSVLTLGLFCLSRYLSQECFGLIFDYLIMYISKSIETIIFNDISVLKMDNFDAIHYQSVNSCIEECSTLHNLIKYHGIVKAKLIRYYSKQISGFDELDHFRIDLLSCNIVRDIIKIFLHR